jgi:hypothetical protein
VAEGAGEPTLVGGAQRVAVVLDQPEAVRVAELADLTRGERVAERVGEHDRLRARRERGFEQRHVRVRGLEPYVDEDRDSAELHDRRDGGRESRGHGDDLVAAHDTTLAEPLGGERGEREQVGGRTGVHEVGVPDAQVVGELTLEPVCPLPVGEPEVERRVDQRHDLALVEHATRIADLGDAGSELRLLGEGGLVVLADLVEDLAAKGFGVVRAHVCATSRVRVTPRPRRKRGRP